MYCIAFNGPPRSGKDSIAFEIDSRFDMTVTATVVRSLSMPMRKVAFAMLDIPYSYVEYERIKDQTHEVFGGQTLRQFMILYSENFAKKHYGETIWAKSLLSGLGTSIHLPGICLIPDIGFQRECNHLQEAFAQDRFLLIRLSRQATSFQRDSRSYVEAENLLTLLNTEDGIKSSADAILRHCKVNLGWEL